MTQSSKGSAAPDEVTRAIIAGPRLRYVPPVAVPTKPSAAWASPSRSWLPDHLHRWESEAFAVTRPYGHLLAAVLVDRYGVHPRLECFLPGAFDPIHPDFRRFTSRPALEAMTPSGWGTWAASTPDARMHARVWADWDEVDPARSDALRGGIWREGTPEAIGWMLDATPTTPASFTREVEVAATDAASPDAIRVSAREALSRWGRWQAEWELLPEERATLEALSEDTFEGVARVPFAAFARSVSEVTSRRDFGRAWREALPGILVRSAPTSSLPPAAPFTWGSGLDHALWTVASRATKSVRNAVWMAYLRGDFDRSVIDAAAGTLPVDLPTFPTTDRTTLIGRDWWTNPLTDDGILWLHLPSAALRASWDSAVVRARVDAARIRPLARLLFALEGV